MSTAASAFSPELSAFLDRHGFLRKDFISCIVEVLSQGISQNRLEDAEAALACVRMLRPRLVELDTFDAWIAMKRGFWIDAMRHLRNIDASTSNWALGKALLAFCQFATRDPTWQASANEVLEDNNNAEAVGLMRLLIDPEGSVSGKAQEHAPTGQRETTASPARELPPGYLRA